MCGGYADKHENIFKTGKYFWKYFLPGIAPLDPHVDHSGDGNAGSSEEAESDPYDVVTPRLQVLHSDGGGVGGVVGGDGGGVVGVGGGGGGGVGVIARKYEGRLHHQNVPEDWKEEAGASQGAKYFLDSHRSEHRAAPS